MTGHLVASGLAFPTSLAFDERGNLYVAEAGLPFGGAPAGGTVLAIGPDGSREVIGKGFRPPVNGLSFHDGALYVSEGGHPGQITRLALDGSRAVVIGGLPGPGNYHTNMALAGPDGWLYFSQGAMTNTGVVGLDSYELGWLRRLPHAHDVPGIEIVLEGVNFETDDPLTGGGLKATTGAFQPFGCPSEKGQLISAGLPCTAALMRCQPDGSRLELVAWGLRNAYGLGFLPDGRLLAIDQGADDRGSRPIGNAPDAVFEVVGGAWYGWPDYIAGEPITAPSFLPQRGPAPGFLLADHASLPPPSAAVFKFPPHSAATKFCAVGEELYVALFGDERPMTAPAGPPAGRSLARLSTRDWSLRAMPVGPLHRPIDVGLNPMSGELFVLDFGFFEMQTDGTLDARPGTGGVWRIA